MVQSVSYTKYTKPYYLIYPLHYLSLQLFYRYFTFYIVNIGFPWEMFIIKNISSLVEIFLQEPLGSWNSLLQHTGEFSFAWKPLTCLCWCLINLRILESSSSVMTCDTTTKVRNLVAKYFLKVFVPFPIISSCSLQNKSFFSLYIFSAWIYLVNVIQTKH